MNKQNKRICILPAITTVGFEFAKSTAVVAIRVSVSPPDYIVHIPTVFISAVSIACS